MNQTLINNYWILLVISWICASPLPIGSWLFIINIFYLLANLLIIDEHMMNHHQVLPTLTNRYQATLQQPRHEFLLHAGYQPGPQEAGAHSSVSGSHWLQGRQRGSAAVEMGRAVAGPVSGGNWGIDPRAKDLQPTSRYHDRVNEPGKIHVQESQGFCPKTFILHHLLTCMTMYFLHMGDSLKCV